ncbi:MAG TPA: radical SAM protein [Myxococcota bacterium]|nr:radical SAM protein [Myxococcota bacterium]HQK50472.1 radical SAM protein [Myxococcota bacterium]
MARPMQRRRPRLLLVSPRHEFRNLWALKEMGRQMGRKVATTPLALPVLAALAPSTWEVRIVDEEMDEVPVRDSFDLVAFTTLSTNVERGYALARLFREAGIRVVMGGPYASTRTQEVLEHCDAVVVGEAEDLFGDLLSDVQNNRLQPVYQARSLPSPDRIPSPRWDLVDTRQVMALGVQVSRGCPHHCDFCLVHHLYGRRPRYRPLEAVLQEIRGLPGRFLSFVDDNLTARKDYARQLMAGLKPLEVQWSALASLEVTRDQDLLRDMAEAGCSSLVLGFESLTEEGLAEARKTQFRIDEYERAIEALHRAGIHCIGAFVLGFDSDGPEAYDAVREFARRNGLSYLMLNLLTVLEGTDLERRVTAEGRRIPLPPSFQNSLLPNKRGGRLPERETYDRFLDLLDHAYSWADLREKARRAFSFGGFRRAARVRPSLATKVSFSARLIRSYLLSRDPDKRGLFRDLYHMGRRGDVAMDQAAQFLMMAQGLRSYVDRLLARREELWGRYADALARVPPDAARPTRPGAGEAS